MENLFPHFKYSTRGDLNNHYGHIDADGELVHWIKNLNEFYRVLGYTASMAKQGIMPDEFIWDEYVKDGTVNSTACLQLHIIEYLSKHSDNFRNKYRDQYKGWIEANVDAKPVDDELCLSCSMNQFCADPKNDRHARPNIEVQPIGA